MKQIHYNNIIIIIYIVNEYVKFMALKVFFKDFNAKFLSPSAKIDQIWHLHILDTVDYQKIWKFILPNVTDGFIHHDPNGGEGWMWWVENVD